MAIAIKFTSDFARSFVRSLAYLATSKTSQAQTSATQTTTRSHLSLGQRKLAIALDVEINMRRCFAATRAYLRLAQVSARRRWVHTICAIVAAGWFDHVAMAAATAAPALSGTVGAVQVVAAGVEARHALIIG